MAGYNRIVLIGNLTRDPEMKQLPSGQALCRLGLAINRQYKNRQTGQQVQEVCFIDIDVWGVQADSCQKYLSKGKQILVEGRLKFDTWQDPQGVQRSKHSVTADRVVFLSSGVFEGDDVQDESTSYADKPAVYTTKNTEEFEKIEQAVAKKQAAKKATDSLVKQKNKLDESLVEFKDQAPFEDELPF